MLGTISKIRPNLTNKSRMVVISKEEYGDFLLYKKNIQKKEEEEMDIDEAIKVYKKEKKAGKLKKLKSLADLD